MLKKPVYISPEEVEELLAIIKNFHGFDFFNYSRASIKRRFSAVMTKLRLDHFSLKQKLVNDPAFFEGFINEVTVNVTEMFRDPAFYASVREKVIPYLGSYPFARVWNAGCATGEETYSFAILLEEAGLLNRSFLYGTDINTKVLEKATGGIFNKKDLDLYRNNYTESGGKQNFEDYYTEAYQAGIFREYLRSKILFSVHNLAIDNVFNEFHVVVCRNVLIYFNEELQERALRLAYDSLCHLGFLCLGSKETIRSPELKSKFRDVDPKNKIYQKIA